jgi:hypothetical protein
MARSIGGFNSAGYGSFGEGEQLSARGLNRMAIGIDKAQTMYSQGIQYQASNGGVAYNEPYQTPAVYSSFPPFTVYLTKDEDADAVGVTVGTVNNVIPLINGTLMTNPTYTPILLPTSAGDYQIVIKCKADPPPASFPKLDTEIKYETYPTTDTDDYGFIAIANVRIEIVDSKKTITLSQLVSGSLWAERHKYTEPDTAWYYFYRV